MNKWERLNGELADAQHYADDMKERVAELERENAELRARVAMVPTNAIYKLFFELFGQYERGPIAEAVGTVGTWLETQAARP